MKPCLSIKRIESLMTHHTRMAQAHRLQSEFHTERIQVLQEYIQELTKPGFKVNSYIIAGTTRKNELFVTSASNTTEI